MFAKKRHPHTRQSSASTTHANVNASASASASTNADADADVAATPKRTHPRSDAVSPPLVSPLQMTFDFELSPSPSSTAADDYPQLSPFSPIADPTASAPRPQTSTGVGSIRDEDVLDRTNGIAASRLQSPPMLPLIPRVTSTAGGFMSSHLNENIKPGMHEIRETQAGISEEVSSKSSKSVLSPRLSFDFSNDMLPWSPAKTSSASRPRTAGGAGSTSTSKMEYTSLVPVKTSASLFPLSSSSSKQEIPLSAVSPNVPVMSRQFIDSRDKPYSQPPPRPILTQHTRSTPNLYHPQSPALARGPTPVHGSSKNFLSPQPSLQTLSQRTDFSGSTARPSTRASTQTALTGPSVTTIGMPYQATADSFPLPQHVMTRPKTPGAAARIGGVSVPTHHTSSFRTANGARPVEARESKKKRRLTLNPLALLQRRQTSQLPEEVLHQRQEQEQALQRQRDLLVSGVNKTPPDFDPRIKGRVVHDFSAPRGKRNTFDGVDVASMTSPPIVQSTQSSPVVPTMSSHQPRKSSLTHRGSDGEQAERRSLHTPAFKEHLDEAPESSRRISSIQAESLENKDFLQRASRHNSALTNLSQESATLPPFARRSQILDPSQAAYYNDESSKASTSSEQERGSSLGSINEISPVTARSSHILPPVQQNNARQSQSPVSPASPGRIGDKFRPVSAISPPPPSTGDSQAASQMTPKTSDDRAFSANERITRPYSVVMAPPAINSVSETSNESSPAQSPSRDHSDQKPQVVLRGVSIQQSRSNDGLDISSLQPPSLAGTSSADSLSEAPSVDRTTRVRTPERTLEPEVVESMQFKPDNGQPKLVEKRASAVGHSRKSSNMPRHASTASRFSFQFGGNESAAQEQALEEKHRKMRSGQVAQSVSRGHSPDEDDEDDFDEDAMYDMDEMEMENDPDDAIIEQPARSAQSANYLQQARQALQQQDSDDDSNYADDIPGVIGEGDLPYPDHPAFRTHSAVFNNYSRPDSYASQGGQGGYWRDSTIDHYMRDETYLSEQAPNPGQDFDFRVKPNTADRSAATDDRAQNVLSPIQSESDERPTLPARDSGNSERNRAASGMSFAPTSTAGASTERNASAGASTATMDRDHIVSGMSYSSISESVKSPLQGTFYKHTGSAKSSPYLASDSFSPPFPDEHDSWLNDDGMASSMKSPEREAALVSLEANSRTRTSSSDSHGDDLNIKAAGTVVKSAAPAGDTKSPTRSPYSDGRRNGSIGALSFSFSESPDKSQLGHHSNGSGMSFEEFAKGGFSQATSPALPSDELGHTHRKIPGQIESPTTTRANAASRSLKSPEATGSPSNAPTGLGLTMFTGIDFNNDASVVPATAPTGAKMKDGVANVNEHTTPARSRRSGPNTQEQNDDGVSWELSTPSPSSVGATSVMPTIVVPFTTADNMNRVDDNAMQIRPQPANSQNVQQSVRSFTGVRHDVEMTTDDMYFDDGNFDQDINGANGGSMDEDAFDDDKFLSRPGYKNRYMHSRDHSGLSALSAGSDGPYPAFAIPNSQRVSQRYSQMMLEDLPLQAPVDPRYVPQRNPSEDAKRLGLGSRVPPAPVPETDKEAFGRMQRSLQSYHSALADAANKAAAEGRFVRAPSISTTDSAENPLSFKINDGPMNDDRSVYATSVGDDRSVYSNGEDGGEIHMPYLSTGKGADRNGSIASHVTHLTSYSPTKFSFDFGFDHDSVTDDINDNAFDDDMFGNDDDLVAAANAEVLASEDGGFYGQEFGFYGRPRSNSDELRAINGGFFGEDGDDGLSRNKSLREPNLTPITERSEFSTRSSFVGLGGPFGPTNASQLGPFSPAIARFGHSPVDGLAPASFDELRRLRGQAFGGGGGPRSSDSSARSNSNRSSQQSLQALSPSVELKPGPYGSGYFGGSLPMQYGYSTDSNGSRNSSLPNSAHPTPGMGFHFNDSPQSATSSNGLSLGVDLDATPRKNSVPLTEPTTAKKVAANGQGHSRSGSGADSVTYVREPDPEHNGKQRWVLERRRTSEQGQLELIGRELVQGGWI
ncbi:hypothetical protein DOTSEDRAFT_33983 [Dothistroma septosporum NZE10]|uniref:Uncharacterized protein n=1 Tax=Dothistroma septosporum (strain NZE10 / CBS 128990) TaxID=675120 RepID=N1PQ18_DOTSN|nr:hypothetical protein DOTSEDRAFT_33983 [Dothistroma septosporum NZE10]